VRGVASGAIASFQPVDSITEVVDGGERRVGLALD